MQRPDNTTLALLAGIAVLVIIIAIHAATRDSDQDRLGDYATVENAAAAPDLAKACASQAVYDMIKSELFNRAVQIRGEDNEAYARIAQAAVARMENPTMEGDADENGVIACTGSLSLDLPPGLEASGGRHRLMADVDYSVDTKAGRAVSLRNADALVNSLASLARIDSQADQPLFPSNAVTDDGLMPEEAPTIDDGSDAVPLPRPMPRPPAARPSFDCSRAQSQSERAICADPGLADLDRAMSAEYQRAYATSDPAQAALLRQTRSRFLAYRDNCPNAACIADAYTGRIREIQDIASGRWQAR